MMNVRRDPFARGELARFSTNPRVECAWCGDITRTKYFYIWSPDDRPVTTLNVNVCAHKPFCNLSCFDSYRG